MEEVTALLLCVRWWRQLLGTENIAQVRFPSMFTEFGLLGAGVLYEKLKI